jgi:uncharacterized RDD family membrane protein YckC
MGTTVQLDMGHWIIRLIALIIDSILLGVIAWILVNFVFVSVLFTGSFYPLWIGYGYTLVFPFVLGILEVLYFVILEISWGYTFGKKIMNLRVQMTNGQKVTIDKALIRNISKIYPLFLILDWLIAIVTPGSDPRQKYTDRIADTTVVQI